LATGEFIEEQIFNWTYTDEQRAKEKFATKNPDKWNPYGALPQMRLLTYQMPDELLAIASGGEFDEFDLNAFFEASDTVTDAWLPQRQLPPRVRLGLCGPRPTSGVLCANGPRKPTSQPGRTRASPDPRKYGAGLFVSEAELSCEVGYGVPIRRKSDVCWKPGIARHARHSCVFPLNANPHTMRMACSRT
jgi:hypothetical protein